MAPSIGIGNLTREPLELNSSALNLHNALHNLIQVNPSLINRNDIYVAHTGGLKVMRYTDID